MHASDVESTAAGEGMVAAMPPDDTAATAICLIPLIGPFHLRSPRYNAVTVRDTVAFARERGIAYVDWLTQDFNATARQLYDRIATETPFIKYQR